MIPRQASTVVLVRENPEVNGIETLLLLRNAALMFAGGAWVFPGGKVDASDYPSEVPGFVAAQLAHQAAINAGIRETQEEAGLIVDPADLIPIAHWTTPPGLSHRFATWFFLCPLRSAAEIVVDAGEIVDYQWLTPVAALKAHGAGRIRLPMPTAHTLKSLVAFHTLNELCIAMKRAEIYVFPENSDYYQPPPVLL